MNKPGNFPLQQIVILTIDQEEVELLVCGGICSMDEWQAQWMERNYQSSNGNLRESCAAVNVVFLRSRIYV